MAQKLTNDQWLIKDNTRIAINITDSWLKQNGITPEALTKVKPEILQATKIATNILDSNDKSFLHHYEREVIYDFLKMARSNKRNKLTKKQCFAIVNISYHIGRRKTKANKKIQKLRQESVKSGSEV
jgi:hypothetical protein